MDALFDVYRDLLPSMGEWARARYPKDPGDSDFVYKQTIKAKACDSVRGVLPAATISNVGIYGTGQAFEALLLRMRAHPLPEAHVYAEMMLEELRKVIPSFLSRLDRPDRGGAWVEYLESTRYADRERRRAASSPTVEPEPTAEVTLTDWDPDGEDKVLAAICYPYAALPEAQLLDRVRRLGVDERAALLLAYVGERHNRRHKPGRAFERTDYRFDVLGDYGAFRDLQRHRMLTIEWQVLSPQPRLRGARVGHRGRTAGALRGALERSAELYDDARRRVPGAGAVRGVARVPDAVLDADERA